MHIGITPWDLGSDHTADWLGEQGAFAEALGFDSFFLPENHFTGRGAVPEPLMLLAAVAARTSRILLGTTSLLLPVRHPIQTAEQVAVLDRLSGGRVLLGLGRGYQPALYDAFDVSLKDKRRKFDACLALMIRAWRGESVSTREGSVVLSPLPVQQPHPPLWVAAFGPKALAQAGRLGLPYLASPMESLDVLRTNYAALAEAAVANAHPVPQVVPVMRSVFVSEDASTIARVRVLLDNVPNVGPNSGPNSGPNGGVVVRRADAQLDDWAIIGTPAEVRARIMCYQRDVGMTHLIATRLRVAGMEHATLRRSLALLAEIHRDLQK